MGKHINVRKPKPCKKCGVFEKTKDGSCKPCKIEYNKAYTKENKEVVNVRSQKWRDNNKELMKSILKTYKTSNKDKVNKRNAEYRASKIQAIPSWYNEYDVQAVYTEAKVLEDKLRSCVSCEDDFELKIHVDHIVPLKGINVCGLHTLDNLQILSGLENCTKNNIFKESCFGKLCC